MLENITLNKKERIQPSRNKNHAKNSAIEKIQFFFVQNKIKMFSERELFN